MSEEKLETLLEKLRKASSASAVVREQTGLINGLPETIKKPIDPVFLKRVKTKILTFVAAHGREDDWTNYTLYGAMRERHILPTEDEISASVMEPDDFNRAYWQALEELLDEKKIWLSSSWHEDDGKNFFIRQRKDGK